MAGKNVISFSLWGRNNFYWLGGIANAKLIPEIYPEFTGRFYIDVNSIIPEYVKQLKDLGSEVVEVNDPRGSYSGMFWRFLPCSDPEVDIMLSRDCDSRVNPKERACYENWIKTDSNFFTIHDNLEHNIEILGGMWGCKCHILRDMKQLIDQFGCFHRYGIDQQFLQKMVWPRVKDTVIDYGTFFKYAKERTRPFPPHKSIAPQTYCGERVNP